ncbi:sugar O-acetyltransferase [Secundilactobacillus mixtipabuli]|uniref:Galactoside O-acetyltransferase n=1 Tax=Secundilactobacillus mixtipabuli TaxID=1435342 RepID=A0A1Z5IBP5_9LACO|nr:sugar O-acetyltransferase [Secundilactobacillus mixtipabuli]GAW99179.1 galactoside O-acetyltransferase [Secundilactobacillus mixtipabuli]
MTTELEKQQHGELYDAHDPIFKQYKDEANHFLMVYNQTPYDQADKRRQLLEQSLGEIGKQVTVGTPFLCDFARNIHLGSKISINMNCSFMDSGEIRIDSETMIAPNVQIYTGTHPVPLKERLNHQWDAHPEQHFVRTRSLPVHIKHGCWIGGGVIILPGVTIGEGTVIGAGSVVTKDIPDHVVAVGNPCHVLRKIEE